MYATYKGQRIRKTEKGYVTQKGWVYPTLERATEAIDRSKK